MSCTIEEAMSFKQSAEKARECWLKIANLSWQELRKRQPNNKLWAVTPNSVRKRARYPAWYSVYKIRQPLVLSRLPIPIGRDTTQDGNDNIGATAAIIIERLATNLARSFDFYDVLCCARDDFLATNVGQVRAYYEREEVKQKVKEYIQPQETETGMVFVGADGKEIFSDEISQDDEGYYIEHDQTIDVDNERIILEPVFYQDFFVDPDIRRWERCKRIAFAYNYSEREFKDIFGAKALTTRPTEDKNNPGEDEASPKNQTIRVIEYWDKYEKEVYWFIDGGSEFIKPLSCSVPPIRDSDAEEDNGVEDDNDECSMGLYDLEGFFPCPMPLTMNQTTNEFWPTPEYYQIYEMTEEIHSIFSNMMTLTRAIRPRLLFDNNIEGLQEALNEAATADAFGVTNLAQLIASGGGTLEGVVQYIPVEKMIQALQQLYQAFEQRLNSFYKITGTSDLLQGLITDPTQRTFGERQMTEKYALNQLAEPQSKMAEFARGAYQLMVEMAIKNFKDSSLDYYVMPQTMEPEHQERYRPALDMLRQDMKRFRVEIETDSTIALNEEYDKAARIELVNTLTSAIEKVANVAGTSPALVGVDLHALKFLIQGFRQGKLFQQEITEAIDNVIQMANEQPAPFNKEQSDFELKQQEFQLKAQAEQQKAATANASVQVENYRAQSEASYKQQDINLRMQRDQLLGQLAVLNFQLDQQIAGVETQKAGVEIQNKLADNERLEALAVNDIQNGPERAAKAPQVVVVPSAPAAPVIVAPQAAPVAGPTIINAPNPAPQTSVIQPVQQVPVPIL
jgi:hypothetical protein